LVQVNLGKIHVASRTVDRANGAAGSVSNSLRGRPGSNHLMLRFYIFAELLPAESRKGRKVQVFVAAVPTNRP
jgi:hypothetical protein